MICGAKWSVPQAVPGMMEPLAARTVGPVGVDTMPERASLLDVAMKVPVMPESKMACLRKEVDGTKVN